MISGSKGPSGISTHGHRLAIANRSLEGPMTPGFKVPGGSSVGPLAATNGPFRTPYNPFGFPVKLDPDPWTAPVSVCHTCGSTLK